MRIAHVVTGGVDRSGCERIIPALLTRLERQARTHDVTVYVLRHYAEPRSYRLAGATIHDLGRPRGVPRQYAVTLAAIRAHGPHDVLERFERIARTAESG
jgi:hypothetical protein